MSLTKYKGFKRMLIIATGALLVTVGFGCENTREAIDDFNSEATCGDYCSKKFECASTDPTTEETDTCVSNCRDSLENNCGNENQDAANDKINECVDLGCVEFAVCMVFEAAPECFGFVDE